jgi:hypothetical protein
MKCFIGVHIVHSSTLLISNILTGITNLRFNDSINSCISKGGILLVASF